MNKPPFFVVATPNRSVCDDHARVLIHAGYLRRYAVAQNRLPAGIPKELTQRFRSLALLRRAAEYALSVFQSESFRFRLHPWFDQWVKRQLQPGDHLISSYGYTNDSFDWIRQHGGKTYLDGGNSHPDQFWEILLEEHRRWNSPYPPVAFHHHQRARAMMEKVDFVLSPSRFVTDSFLSRGFTQNQILSLPYPVNLSCFTSAREPRLLSRPLTIVNTGMLCLRKGTPYLLEAFRLVLKTYPQARLRLINILHNNIRPILARYADLPIDWSPPLSHEKLADYLRQSDLFVLPSLEDGFARTVSEALSCGLPVVTTPNTGASDLIAPGINGEIVPLRDAEAIAHAILKWADRLLKDSEPPPCRLLNPEQLSFDFFQQRFLEELKEKNLLS